ncbi:hypothetical protein [Nocardia transvalensis]|uniref:hypothetical protein n=1 Tax=Nocardia transvalensis TaxID=37333 RepID=UPI001894C284|nr:hypothetical protein [Nocardia transvalensis]MBF6332977.1 hypothetical protein [Nocardia transvalensis]
MGTTSIPVYLFYCDSQWTCVTDTWHGDLAAAMERAVFEFGPVEFADVPTTLDS